MSKKVLLMMLLMAIFAPWAANAQSELTVYDGSATNGNVPVYGWYADAYNKAEMIMPAADLEEMTSGTISKMTWYLSSPAAAAWGANYQVYLKEVDNTTFTTTFLGVDDATLVWEGPLDGTGSTIEIEFDNNYTYGGGNLFIAVYQTELGTYKSAQFAGEAVTSASISNYSYSGLDGITSGTARDFLPKTTFEYAPAGGGPTCEKPATLEVTDITGFGATCTWESEVGNYTFEWKKASETEWNVVPNLTTTTYELNNLEPYTAYSVRVKAVCGTDLESGYKTANFTTLDVCPDGMVCIGEGTATNSYLPTYIFYNYSLTQQIYTAEEIGMPGLIESVDIYSVGSATRTLEIYMVSTDKDHFEDGTDWIPATEGDLVFSGEVDFAANSWNTMVFDNGFTFDGRTNVALIVRDMTGSYVSSISFFVFETGENQAIRAYRDTPGAYDIAAPGVTGTVLNVKNRVRFGIGEPPACPKPSLLTVNYDGGIEATITWNSDADSFNIDVNGIVTEGVTNPYTLSDLELDTQYTVKVQANCDGDEVSEWAGPVSFTTDACMPEDMTIVNYSFADSYGDGWNDNYILVVDENCEIVEALTIESGSSASGTLKVCGAFVQFMWYMGTYPGETSWVFTDANGEVLFEGAGSSSMATYDVLYTIDLNPVKVPTDLEVGEVGPHSATLGWTENGTATAWQIGFFDDDDELVFTADANTNPYTVTGLDPETDYYVRVCAVGNEGMSMWPCLGMGFTTTVACPAPTNLAANDVTAISALISWNGWGESYDLRYMPVAGAIAPEEKAFTGNHNHDLQLKANPDAQRNANTKANRFRDGWYYYDNGEFSDGIGTGGSNVYWAIMLPAGMTSETSLTKVALYENSSQNADSTITLFVYAGGTDAPGTLLYTEEIEPEAADAFHEITLATPVEVDPLQNLWIVFKQYGAYPAQGCVNTGNANGRWISLDGEAWDDVASYDLEYTWMIRAYLEGEAVMPWIDVTGINANEYELTDLDPETTYVVQVRANCGDDGQSEWTSSLEFTTGSMCDAPYDLTASDITFTSVTLDWVSALESFNLQYRPIVHGEVYAEQNFDENSMGDWTTIDADGDGYDWVLGSQCGGVYLVEGGSLAGSGHNSSADLIVSGSYSNVSGVGALEPDNYLVSPQVTLGGTISFWACGQDASYAAEHFGVAVSTTVNDDAAAFTTIQEWTMTAKGSGTKANPSTTRSGESLRAGTWYQYTVDLSEYAGQTGYVAIRHFGCTDMFMLDVDDIVIAGHVETPEWIEINETRKPVILTDLTYKTEYEWQVQGINAGCDDGLTPWSEIATFTFPMPVQTINLEEGWNWVSLYVTNEDPIELLDLLKAALGENATQINASEMFTEYEDGEWFGDLDEEGIFNEQTYMIYVNTACTVEIEGEPADLEDYIIEINPDWNWIGFPSTEVLDINEALADFEAEEGDLLLSSTDFSEFDGEEWYSDTFNELKPGQGYLYFSNSDEPKILVFQTGVGINFSYDKKQPVKVKVTNIKVNTLK